MPMIPHTLPAHLSVSTACSLILTCRRARGSLAPGGTAATQCPRVRPLILSHRSPDGRMALVQSIGDCEDCCLSRKGRGFAGHGDVWTGPNKFTSQWQLLGHSAANWGMQSLCCWSIFSTSDLPLSRQCSLAKYIHNRLQTILLIPSTRCLSPG
jgi:hypothetical protein